ncbi:unnamed protein product [Aureobasidium vineae]|uniref:Uncharacterized protein n=1 Tax=Aureobasidium vineae TaxID=2773715 RepID=A0A9N8J8E4_9PEZI|nr:unnamed protein product [Aureobasidium vineae]
MYMHVDLEYTTGTTPSAHEKPTLLHTFLEKLSPTTSSLYHHLTIIDGSRNLTAKDMRILVDLINSKLPNLLTFSLEAVNPETKAWPDFVTSECWRDFL